MDGTQRNHMKNSRTTGRGTPKPKNRAEAERIRALRQEKLRKRRRRQRILVCCNIIMAFVLLGILISWGRQLWSVWMPEVNTERQENTDSNETGSTDEGTDEIPAAEVADSRRILDNKRILEDAEVEETLKKLAAENIDIEDIYVNREKYPEELLAALAGNEEMTEFVKGYLTAEKVVNGGFDMEEAEQDFPLFLQWDTRWGYAPYGGSCIGIAGCGPTCLSMVIFSLTKDESATPDKLADFSMNNGHYVEGIGTAWTLMTEAVGSYGIQAFELGLDEEAMKQHLDWGNPIICAMRPGDFTTTGHFIVIYGYDENGFMVNDPNSTKRSEKRWTFETLQYQIKNLWAYDAI